MQHHVTVHEWVDMFKVMGFDEQSMLRWHREFESRHPEAHQDFLEWLRLPPEKIEEIRTKSR